MGRSGGICCYRASLLFIGRHRGTALCRLATVLHFFFFLKKKKEKEESWQALVGLLHEEEQWYFLQVVICWDGNHDFEIVCFFVCAAVNL